MSAVWVPIDKRGRDVTYDPVHFVDNESRCTVTPNSCDRSWFIVNHTTPATFARPATVRFEFNGSGFRFHGGSKDVATNATLRFDNETARALQIPVGMNSQLISRAELVPKHHVVSISFDESHDRVTVGISSFEFLPSAVLPSQTETTSSVNSSTSIASSTSSEAPALSTGWESVSDATTTAVPISDQTSAPAVAPAGRNNGTLIAGVVSAILLVFILTGGLVFWFIRRRHQPRSLASTRSMAYVSHDKGGQPVALDGISDSYAFAPPHGVESSAAQFVPPTQHYISPYSYQRQVPYPPSTIDTESRVDALSTRRQSTVAARTSVAFSDDAMPHSPRSPISASRGTSRAVDLEALASPAGAIGKAY